MLSVLSRIPFVTQVPVSARFEIYSRLASLVNIANGERRADWGVTRCPALEADLKNMPPLPAGVSPELSSGLWMVPGKDKLYNEHGKFFLSIDARKRTYTVEHTVFAGAERRVLDAGAKYAGYSGWNGTIHLRPDYRGAAELWLLDRGTEKCRLLRFADGKISEGENAPPFSPLFVIPSDRLADKVSFNQSGLLAAGPYYREP